MKINDNTTGVIAITYYNEIKENFRREKITYFCFNIPSKKKYKVFKRRFLLSSSFALESSIL